MSRPIVRSRARESVFTFGLSQSQGESLAVCSPNVMECVLAMEDCCEEAHAAQELLRAGTSDLPRISRVLASEKVFLLVDESTIRRYKSELGDEIEPQITELLERADSGLKALNKHEAQLQAKVEAAQARPTRPPNGPSTAMKLEARRLQQLVRQRERLEEELARTEEEAETLESKLFHP